MILVSVYSMLCGKWREWLGESLEPRESSFTTIIVVMGGGGQAESLGSWGGCQDENKEVISVIKDNQWRLTLTELVVEK